ncbi:MAG TPA: hypothetical protein VEF72_32460 [Mycobacterium sp.]|nr:hypothetical protein [Mycobacterium sp.]
MLFAVFAGFATAAGICGVGAADTESERHPVRYEVNGNSPVAEYISYQTDTGQ